MVTNRFGRFFLVLAFVGLLPLAAFAEEVVHFTNGAEMTVKSHVVENDKSMVKVDLGGNNSISFPMTMVDKIVNAGTDVFLNPAFHASNQAIAGGAVSVVADTTVRGVQGGSGYNPQPDGKGHAGTMLGEVADQNSGGGAPMGALTNDTMANARRRFNPARQQAAAPGAAPAHHAARDVRTADARSRAADGHRRAPRRGTADPYSSSASSGHDPLRKIRPRKIPLPRIPRQSLDRWVSS